MTTILSTIIEHKKKEISDLSSIDISLLSLSDRDFEKSLQKTSSGDIPCVIAEIKPRSPSRGDILPPGTNISEYAKTLEKSGASALSVLTDEHFFGGSFDNLRKASETTNIPILCKDFILSPIQIHHARKNGAHSFLLIAQVLETSEIQFLLNEGRKWNMEALVEIVDEKDLEKVLQTDAKIIGINNRDLRTFELSLARTFLLAKKIPSEKTLLSLSGFFGSDVRLVRGVADGVLIGTGVAAKEGILENFLHPKPLVKCCGVRSVTDFCMAWKAAVPLVGLNFVSDSKRCISEEEAKKITGIKFPLSRGNQGGLVTEFGIMKQTKNVSISPRSPCLGKKRVEKDLEKETPLNPPLSGGKYPKPKLVGVFQNQSREECERICEEYALDFCQLSGEERAEDFQNFPFPIIKGVALASEKEEESLSSWENTADIWLFDGSVPGSGKSWNLGDREQNILKNLTKPFLIAGGITPENATDKLLQSGADGVDTASGVENEKGEGWSEERVRKISDQIYLF